MINKKDWVICFQSFLLNKIMEGVEVWPDGSRYEGDFHQGKKHGKGKFIWADGSSFNGQFIDNNIEGIGYKLKIK